MPFSAPRWRVCRQFARLMGHGIPRMMKTKTRLLPLWLFFAAALFTLLPASSACAQQSPASPDKPEPAQTRASEPAAPVPDRAQAYYHLALANVYEEQAVTSGRPEYINFAID